MWLNKAVKMVFSIGICLATGAIGSIYTMSAITGWYVELNKPSFTPPSITFGIVWNILFVLMGLALYFIWQAPYSKAKKFGLMMFGLQLVFNMLWSYLFFYLRHPFSAFIEIIALWILITITTIIFFKIKKTAGWLMTPYLLWVSFAIILNYYIWQMN